MVHSFFKSTLIGTGGAVLSGILLITVLTLERAVPFMHWIVAFTGLLIGYRLVEFHKTEIKNFWLAPFFAGMTGGALSWLAINLAGLYIAGGFFLSGVQLIIFSMVSGITSYLGAKLAVRYFNL